MEILEKYFIENSLSINWEYVESLPEFAKLKNCEQNPRWHGEGNAWEHTVKCVEAAYRKVDLYYSRTTDKKAAIAAVLFHDIGKGVTTEFKNGNWHAYGHEFAGEKIARRMLWDEPMNVRETICNAVRYHMDVLRIADSTKDIVKKIITPTFNKFFFWRDVIFVKWCDVYGSIPINEDDTQIAISQLQTMEDITSELNLYTCNSYDQTLYRSYILGKKVLWLRKFKKNIPDVYVLIGLPGSGKNTWIESMKECGIKNYVAISRDDIRFELGYCNEGDKVVLSSDKEAEVSEVFNKRFVEAVSEGKDVVLNNINLKKQYRDAYKQILIDNGINNVNWIYVYIEAKDMETLLHRRLTIPFSVYESMIEKFDYPQPGEYDDILIIKQCQ